MDSQADRIGRMDLETVNSAQFQASHMEAADVAVLGTWWPVLVLLLMLLVVIFFYRRRSSKADPEKFEQQYKLPVWATVPVSIGQVGLHQRGKSGPLTVVEPEDMAVQSVRSLRTALYLARDNRIVVITSAKAGDGSSFIAVNLAAVLAENGRRVLLIDGDLRNGSLHKQFGLPDGNGLTEFLSGASNIGNIISGTGVLHLELISAGSFHSEPEQLLDGGRVAALLEHLVSYDHIVIDTPPLALADDALPVLRLADVVILVMKGDFRAEPLITRIRKESVGLQGVVFNRVNVSAKRRRDGRYFGYS